MKKRAGEILSYLVRMEEMGKTTTINNLAEKYQVSSRTIRNDINEINDYLRDNGKNEITFGKRGGILVSTESEDKGSGLSNLNFYNIKLQKEDRIIYASIILICKDEYITLADLADDLYISRSTMIQDLDDLKSYLRSNNLYLITQSNKGLLLEGEEKTKRSFLFYLIQHNKKLLREPSIYSYLIGCLTDKKELFMEERISIATNINKAEHAYGRYMTDEGFFDLKTYLELISFRIKNGHFVESSNQTENSKYEMAEAIVEQFQERIPHSPDQIKAEAMFLSGILNNVHYLKKTTSNRNIVKIQIITRTFIEMISKEIHMNLQDDYIFFENLSNHVESTFSSIVDNFDISDIVEEVLVKYPEIKEATKKYIHIFEDYSHRKFSEGETSYVALHICAALERKKHNICVNKVYLVCNGGLATTQILSERLNRFFEFSNMEIVSSHEIMNCEMKEDDLVISVIPLRNFNHEYIQVDPFLSDVDCIRLSDYIAKYSKRDESETKSIKVSAEQSLNNINEILNTEECDKEKIKQITTVVDTYFKTSDEILITDLMSPDAIRVDVECENWQDAIRASADYLLKNGYVNQNYVERMVQNIMDNGPYIVLSPGFALPHEALDSGAMKVGMSLVRLKTPVPFGKEGFDPIEWICCLSAIDKEKHLKAMFSLVNLFYDGDYRARLQNCVTERDIYNVIRCYVYDKEM